MILHSMNVIRSAVHYINRGQTPVITLDQPLFAIAKQIQWNWPASHGENQFVIMLGGLHIEMTAFKVLGNWLDGSGWTSVIVDAGVTSSGVADAFIKVSHLTRTRRAHQITAASLYILQQRTYSKYSEVLDNGVESMGFKDWKNKMSTERPHFLYWCLVLELELCVLQLVRSLREANFKHYIECLGQLAPWMFSLDHINYARWLSVHVRDMCTLSSKHPKVFQQFSEGSFVVHKSQRAFSSIALDHAHEQANALVKGDGGAVGLTESPGALLQWMVAGPELARMTQEFEESIPSVTKEDTRHHEQVPGVQVLFKKDVASLVSSFEEVGNPFEEDSKDLFALDSKVIAENAVIQTVKNVITIGQEQYNTFVEERFDKRTKEVTSVISNNKLPLFKSPLEQKSDKKKVQVAALKDDCALFSRLYIACQSREGNLQEFFKHENHPWPPSLAQASRLREGHKSDLVKCMEKASASTAESPQVDVAILDGAVVIQMASPGAARTFQEYSDNVFVPYIKKQLQPVKRVDIIWDVYRQDSLKAATREKRGSGTRRRVTSSSQIPKNWKSFLRMNENKTELFHFLAKQVESCHVEGKELCTAYEEHVLSSTRRDDMEDCTHEEVDTRIMLHVYIASQCGYRKVMVRTIDTDVVVLAVSKMQDIDVDELWIAFGTGKHFRYLAIHGIAAQLGPQKAKALPMLHALTGCDTVSFFSGKGKRTAWDTWSVFPAVTDVLADLSSVPESIPDDSMPLIERFVVLLYSRTSTALTMNEARQELFSKKSRAIENIPPTQAALLQHTKRAAYQAGHVWGTALIAKPQIPSPQEWGWRREGNEWKPVWTVLPQAQESCCELIHCGCKKG